MNRICFNCIKKIMGKRMGTVLKDGSIMFKDQESAIKYGIQRCRSSVTRENPFERGISIKGSRALNEIDGKSGNIDIHNTSEIMIHSHPDTYERGCTTALSEGDYDFFIKNKNIKKIIAVNSKGETYEMEKIPGFDFSKVKTSETFSDFGIKLRRTLFGGNDVPAEQRELLERCIKNKDLDTYYEEFWPKYVRNMYSSMSTLPKHIVDKTHEFWVKYGEEFGVRVKTNFSNFVGK